MTSKRIAGNNKSDFEETPTGEAQRWKREFEAARKALKKFHDDGDKVVKVFLDEQEETGREGQTRWNLFWANVTMQLAMLFGNIPRVDVSRRYADSEDDAGRIAAEMLERILNSDIERDSDTTTTALGYALKDWRISGAGFARLRYVAEFEAVEGPMVLNEETGKEEAPERLTREDAEVDYVYWKDELWGPCRVEHEKRWRAWAADISRETACERFGEEIGVALPVHPAKEKEEQKEPWDRIRVWEIWDKDRKCVYWYCENYPQTLDHKDDTLSLEGFYPAPRPLMANVTTTKLVPKADYLLAQDQYRSINDLSSRIRMLEEAVKASGVCSKEDWAVLSELLDPNSGNKLLPAENWEIFAAKGGIEGKISWLPLEQIVGAISVLVERRREEMEALDHITGSSDLQRGASSVPGETATTSAAKTRLGSVRVDALQREFTRFTSDVQRLKAEIISKHFQPETIYERSNAALAFAKEDPAKVQEAIQLIKSRLSDYRIEVKAETLAHTDFAALRNERTEVIGAISQFMSAAPGLVQALGPAGPEVALEMLQNLVAGLKGASTLEGTLDRGIAQAKAAREAAAANPQQQPNPQLQAEQAKQQTVQLKGQMDLQKEQMKHQQGLERIQAETQAADQQEQSQAVWAVREKQQTSLIDAAERAANPEPTSSGRKPGGGK